MLALTRKAQERLRIALPDGRGIWVTILSIRGAKVRVGIEAPPDVGVAREEIVATTDGAGRKGVTHGG